MANIDDYLVASYRCNGKSNSDADKDVLRDLSGNGYDIKLHGFFFDKWSGYGDDTIAFDSNNVCHKDMVEFTSTKISCQGNVEFDDKWILKLNGMPPSYRIKVSGVSNIGNGTLWANIGREKELNGIMSFRIADDGIYYIDYSNKDVDDQGIYIDGSDYNIKGPFSIELLPSFKDALVADGVGSYGVCDNMPYLDDFTVVCKRKWIKTEGYANNTPLIGGGYDHDIKDEILKYANFTFENFYHDNIGCIVRGLYQGIEKYFDPSNDVVYMTNDKYDGKYDFNLNPPSSILNEYREGGFYLFREDMSFEGYANVALYALDIYNKTLEGDDLKEAINRMNELVVNWKDGVGEVTDQPLTVSPGSGTGNASVSFGSVMNKGLDRTLELEITTPKGVKKTLTVNQEGCRQAYITSDGKRWLTSDNRVYGVLKSDAPCQCMEVTSNTIKMKIDDANPDPIIENSGDSSWIKGRRCLVKKTDSGVAICYLDENNSELFHDGTTPAYLDGSMGQWMTDIPSYRYSHEGGEYDLSDIDNIPNLVHTITLTHNDEDDNIVEWGHKGLFRRSLVGVTEAVNVNNKLWSRKTGNEQSIGNLTSIVFHNYATALGNGFDIIDYETHCKIAHLFYAKYANRNPQEMSQFGYGELSDERIIGTTSSLGNNDGKTSTQISFLGIEDLYGDKYELMSGIHLNGSVYYIYDGFEPDIVPTASYRTIDARGSDKGTYMNKVYWGEHGDMIPVETNASSTTHYCDKGIVAYSGWVIAMRSNYSDVPGAGVAYFYAYNDSNFFLPDASSRIQYRGPIQVIDNPAEFIALPVGF